MDRLKNPNLQILMLTAKQLGDLVNEMIFVGGCATGLLINKKGAPPIRATFDVDAIVQTVSLQEYHRFSKKLRSCGFIEDTSENAPICRFVSGALILDVMPTEETVLGFGNEWYSQSVQHAEKYRLENGIEIKMLSAPYFLMTKFGAFINRGDNDYMLSHDMEDIISVLDGRDGIVDEIKKADLKLQKALAKCFRLLLKDKNFIDSLPGHIAIDDLSQSRVPIVLSIIEEISKLIP